jgi:hypothetical protein
VFERHDRRDPASGYCSAAGDDGEHTALDDYDEGGDGDGDDMSEYDGTRESNIDMDPMWLGKGIHAIPPGAREGAVASAWATFDASSNGKYRPVRHLVFNVPRWVYKQTPEFVMDFEKHGDEATNTRASAYAAVLGLLSIFTARREFQRGIGCVEEDAIRRNHTDEKEIEDALKAIKTVESYMFKYRHYRMTKTVDGKEQFYGPSYHPRNAPTGSKPDHYDAPMITFFTETLYTKLEGVKAGEDDRGLANGIRFHLLVWNSRFSTALFAPKVMRQNYMLHSQGRLTRSSVDQTNQTHARYAKSCRVMVADPDNSNYAKAKFMSIESNRTLYNCLQAIAGEGSGGAKRPFYENEDALGDGSLTRPISAHPEEGSHHALSFEYLFNIRRDDELALTAGMVDEDGVAMPMHPKQTTRWSYMTKEANTKFPYSDGVNQMTDNSTSLIDATLPNKVGSLASVGDTMLEAFWITHRDAADIMAAEREVLEASPSLCRETLRFHNMKAHLAHCFGNELRRGDKRASLIARRMKSMRMVDQDSFDVTPQERQAARTTNVEDDASDYTITLQADVVASKIDRVLRMVDQAKKEKKKQDSEDPTAADVWFHRATGECMTWAFEMFNKLYTDVEHKDSVEPVVRDIWKSTIKLFEKIPSESSGRISIDKNNPRMRRGTANVAFAFDNTMQFKKLSPFGNWQRTLVKIYGSILGVYGRRNDIKQAIHDAAIAPSNPHTMREVLVIYGKMGMAKSMLMQRFAYIFNRAYYPDPAVRCTWIHFAGGGSKCSKESGGIDFASGGIGFADEAVDFIAKSDEEAKNKLNVVKSLVTGKRVSKPRPERRETENGKVEYKTVNHEFFSNTTLVFTQNLGPNCQFLSKQNEPQIPDDDRRAFLDRTVAFVVTETAGNNRTKEDSDFKKTVKDNIPLMMTHALVTGVTYMVKHVVAQVPAWRPSNEYAADMAWTAIDEYMKTNHDIPYPDDRRKTIRRDIALTRAIESAVVQVLVYKETAVSFDDMLPISEPFDESVPPEKRVHVLKPFEFKHLIIILGLLYYDEEIVVSAASSLLDRCLYTMPDVHHILVALAHRHGMGHCKSGQSICSADPNRSVGQADVMPTPGPVEISPASDAHVQPHDDSARRNYAPFGTGFDPGPSVDATARDGTTGCDAASGATVIGYSVRSGTTRVMAAESRIRDAMKVMAQRRIVQHTLKVRASECGQSVVPSSIPSDPRASADRMVRRVMFGGEASTNTNVNLIDGSTITFKRFMDYLLPTSAEVLGCGYVKPDVCNWLVGKTSQTNFTPSDGDTMQLGISPLNQTGFNGGKWSFKVNSSEPQSSERRMDPAWRTPRSSYDQPTNHASEGDAGSGATDGRSNGQRASPRSWVSTMYKEAQSMAKHELSKWHLDPQAIFDRIEQIAFSREEQKRLLSVSSSDDDKGWMHSHTLMRVVKDAFNNQYTGADPVKCIGMSDSVTPDSRQHIIPLHALGWRGAHANTTHAMYNLRDARDATTKLIDVVTNDTAQRRLDSLVADVALPATQPLVSASIQKGSPIQIDNNKCFINSGLFMHHVNLNQEIDEMMSLTQGLRDMHGEVNTTETDRGGTVASAQRRSTDSVVAVDQPPTEAEGAGQGHSLQRLGGRIPASVCTVVSDMINDGRTEPTYDDVSRCIAGAMFTRRVDRELFDKASIFYTIAMHGLFDHEDRGYHANVVKTYPRAFANVDAFKNTMPHTVTRFSEATNNAPEGTISASGARALLTIPRFKESLHTLDHVITDAGGRQNASNSNSTRPNKRRKGLHEFSAERIEMIQRKVEDATGEWVKDRRRLTMLANKESESEGIHGTAMHDSRAFVKDLIRSKHAAGMLSATRATGVDTQSLVLLRIFQESGTNMSINLRRRVAAKEIPPTGDAFIDRRAAYLYPLSRVTLRDGTCEEIERMRIENCIRARIAAINGLDEVEYEAEDDGDKNDANGDGDCDCFDEVTTM